MIVMVDYYNKSANVNRDSIRIRYYGAMRSDCSFLMEFDREVPERIKAGSEVMLFNEDGTMVWGGIAEQAVYKYRAKDFVSVQVFARGYESLVFRKVLPSFSSTFATSAEAVQNIFSSVLSAEGLTLDSDSLPVISDSITCPYATAVSAVEALDFIMNYYGLCWWVDKNKVFKCCESFDIGTSSLTIALGGTSGFTVSEISLAESLEDYRNKQYVTMDNNGYALATDTSGIYTMSFLSGSGEFGNVRKNPGMKLSAYGSKIAGKLLENYPFAPFYVRFVAEDREFSLFDKIQICDGCIGNPAWIFAVTSVDRRIKGGKTVSTVIAKRVKGTTYTPVFNRVKNISFNI